MGTGVKVLNQKTLIKEDFTLGDEYISEDKFSKLSSFNVVSGDIILGTRGSFGNKNRTTFGKCSIVPDDVGKCVLHPCLIRIRLDKSEVDEKFFKIYTNESSLFLEEIVNTSNSTTIEVIYGVTLKDVKFVIPPLEEQNQIVDYLDRKTLKIDSLTKKELHRITLLKEYRQSLISDVVTGKMDIRDEVLV